MVKLMETMSVFIDILPDGVGEQPHIIHLDKIQTVQGIQVKDI